MKTLDYLTGLRFILNHEVVTIDQDDQLVVIAKGSYMVTQINRHHPLGGFWVKIKQNNWNEGVELPLNDFNRFLNEVA